MGPVAVAPAKWVEPVEVDIQFEISVAVSGKRDTSVLECAQSNIQVSDQCVPNQPFKHHSLTSQ